MFTSKSPSAASAAMAELPGFPLSLIINICLLARDHIASQTADNFPGTSSESQRRTDSARLRPRQQPAADCGPRPTEATWSRKRVATCS